LKFIDLTGKQINNWLVIKQVENDKWNHTQYLCECQCEKKTRKIVSGNTLNNGKSKSCGCLKIISSSENGKLNKKYNTYDLTSEYGIGYTSNTNEPFYFDLEDYDKIKNYCWCINSTGYLSSRDKNNKHILMHRIIMNPSNQMVVDHINHNIIDNRKHNLRICLQIDNAKNCTKQINNTTGITGVLWDKRYQKWKSIIGINNKQIHLGYYDDKNDAIKVRKEAEVKYFGEYRYKENV